ncbi:MAG: methionine--tRNA ligase [Promethearchaeota archaeon]
MGDSYKEKWIVTSAWPYINAIPHLGNLIGSVLSADVFARFLRLRGDEVVFVSGSDMHGTPVAVAAKKSRKSTEELANQNHEIIKNLFDKWEISFDNYTHTHNPTHMKFVQDFYINIQKNGYIFEKEIDSLFCEKDNLFLPDRFVEGTCPHCGYESARGDQCDNCQKLLTPLELKEPRCTICGNPPKIKKTRHWYLDFPKLQEKLKEFLEKNNVLSNNVKQMCLNSISEGLPARAITRDLEWGIPAKFKGAENKTIYVWFEAVLGYISAVKEWADKIIKDPKKFDYFWKDKNAKSIYFIGKDNIIFHLIIFPGLLIAYNEDKEEDEKFTLPYNVSSTEWLMFENQKFSKSRGVGIWINEAIELAPVDYWRFNLIYNRPETSDTSFLWSEFGNSIKTLNDNIGNFIHRTLTFINKQFNSIVPERINLDEIDEKFIKKINNIGNEIQEDFLNFKLRKAARDIVNFGKECNIYLNEKAPWHLLKKNKKAAGHVFNICIQAVHALSILLAPIIPSTSRKIREYLNLQPDKNFNWNSINDKAIKAGYKIKKSIPLFEKLDIEELKAKLKLIREKKEKGENMETISYDYFQKLDIRVALVESVEKVPKADKLYKLTIDIGTEKRTIVAGLAKFYKADELLGKKIIVLTNLEPRKLRGVLSKGMLLAADDGKNVSILTIDKDIPQGSKIR